MSATGGAAPAVAGAPTVRPPIPGGPDGGMPGSGVAAAAGPQPVPAPTPRGERAPEVTCPPPAPDASGETVPHRSGPAVARDEADTEAALTGLRRHVAQLVAELPGPLRRLRLRDGGTELEVEWQHEAGSGPASAPGTSGVFIPSGGPPASPAPTALAGVVGAGAPPVPPIPRSAVRSPMVGTFYRAPEPGAAPFVAVGDLVRPGQVVGIVEAMKLMNEITADRAGRVTEVLVADGQPVEYDQPLVALDPA
ncbi:acetyl-CoA carboxylase biotin carboxyl carrier protein [Micromonospora sp. NPDC049900]|uniref:acetyl-CoA carboxylase biotin carboxyl carrier protein n=1 Tax=Micromonospora sp. NPDC049900 TaxID=3364275 RepID=UPI0037A72DEC